MTKDEALKLALEAMEYADACLKKQLTMKYKHEYAQDLLLEAGTAIKEALAQPEQPKVRTGNCFRVGVCASEGHKIAPQRTWVGLTDKEIDELWMSHHDDFGNALSATGYERAIEAALKAKNT